MTNNNEENKGVEYRKRIISAGYKAVDELIKIAENVISIEANIDDISEEDKDILADDKLKNATQTKKIAIADSIEILAMIEKEEITVKEMQDGKKAAGSNFSEQHSQGR